MDEGVPPHLGFPVFTASSWRQVGNLGHWVCGNCREVSTDPLSPRQGSTVADCRHCGRANQISL